MTKNLFKRTVLFLILFKLIYPAFSQKTDSANVVSHFGGAVTVTNNGISLIPNFTLGKPAAIFDMSAGRGKLSFEPQFRFALTGKPWSFIFWWRYKLLNTDKFQVSLGAHPSFLFRNSTFQVDSVSKDYITVQRYLAGEMTPTYSITKDISVGLYYLYSYCFTQDVVKNTNFLVLRFNFSNIKLSKQFFMKFNPQVYYLKMDNDDGFYFSSALTLAKRNFPLSISSLINQSIQTTIPSNYNNFVWNVSLIYSFNNNYLKAK
jgi:hypothetical protein